MKQLETKKETQTFFQGAFFFEAREPQIVRKYYVICYIEKNIFMLKYLHKCMKMWQSDAIASQRGGCCLIGCLVPKI